MRQPFWHYRKLSAARVWLNARMLSAVILSRLKLQILIWVIRTRVWNLFAKRMRHYCLLSIALKRLTQLIVCQWWTTTASHFSVSYFNWYLNTINVPKDISGSHTENCIPMAKWMTSGSSQVTVRFMSGVSGIASGVDLKTKCVPNEIVKSFKWMNRGNLFNATDLCYRCDMRFVRPWTDLELNTTKCLAHLVRNAQLMRLLSMQPTHCCTMAQSLAKIMKRLSLLSIDSKHSMTMTTWQWQIKTMLSFSVSVFCDDI